MIDRILGPVLTFVTLIAATAGFGSALLFTPRNEVLLAQATPSDPVVLETVQITARRAQLNGGGNEAPTPASHAAEGRGVLLHRARE